MFQLTNSSRQEAPFREIGSLLREIAELNYKIQINIIFHILKCNMILRLVKNLCKCLIQCLDLASTHYFRMNCHSEIGLEGN